MQEEQEKRDSKGGTKDDYVRLALIVLNDNKTNYHFFPVSSKLRESIKEEKS